MKTKIKYLLLLSFFMLIIFATNSQARITTNDPSVSSGGTVTITVNSQEAVTSGAINISSNEGLTFVSASGGQSNGTLVAFASSEAKTSGIATYTFKAPTVTEDKTYKVVFKSQDMDADGTTIAGTTATSTVTVKAPATNNTNTTTNNTTTTTTEPTFKSVNQTVYAKSTTNVRSNYSTSSSSLGQLKQGESVTRTGIGDNGWSKVTFNGKTAYIYSSNLTTTKPSDSSVKTLDEIIVEEGKISPEFDSETTKYTLDVGADVENLKITANPTDSKAKVNITGNENFVIGLNTVKITVTAEDGTTRIYTIDVTKAEKQPLQLSTLNITGMTLTPIFSPDVYKYTIDLEQGSNVTDLNIQALTSAEGAKIEVVGNQNFVEGENVITILVSSADGTENTSYQIIVNKPAAAATATGLFSTSNNLTLYIILGALVLAIIIVIIIIIIKLRKNKTNDESDEEGVYNYKFDGNVKDDTSIRYQKKPLTMDDEMDMNSVKPFFEEDEEKIAQEEIEKVTEEKINKKDGYTSSLERNYDYTNGYRKPGNSGKGKHF